jgi:hypothetical protein
MMLDEVATDGRAGCGRFAVRIGAILVLAAAVRLWDLRGQPLTMDEVVEASIARCPASDIVGYADGFPPLFHLTLKAWTKVVPDAEMGRWISVIAGVAAVYAVGRWAQGELGDAAGLVAAGLLAISPLHVYFSQEMRAYSLYMCFVAYAMKFFFAALKSDRVRDWTGFVIAVTMGVYTHYYTAVAAGVMALVFVGRWSRLASLRRGMTAFAVLGLGCLPAAIVLVPGDVGYQETYGAQTSFVAAAGHTVYALFAGYSLGPSLSELHSASLREAAVEAAPWVCVIAIAAGWLLAIGAKDLRERPAGLAVAFIAAASIPLIGMLGAIAGVGFKVRYWSWVLLPVVVWLAAGIARGWRGRAAWVTRSAVAALAAMQVTAVSNRFESPRYANEDVRSTAQRIADQSSPATPVFVVAEYMAPAVRYYLNGPPTLYHWLPRMAHAASDEPLRRVEGAWFVYPPRPEDVRKSPAFDDAAIATWRAAVVGRADEGGHFWLIYTRAFHGDPGGRLLKRLTDDRWIEHASSFAGVELYRGTVPADRRELTSEELAR